MIKIAILEIKNQTAPKNEHKSKIILKLKVK